MSINASLFRPARRLLVSAAAGALLAMPALAQGVVGGVFREGGAPRHAVALLKAGVPDPAHAQFCGGTLLAGNWVLTAAHCVSGVQPAEVDVAVGFDVLGDVTPSDRLPVDRIAVHPGFRGPRSGHDIALVHLAAEPAAGAVPVALDPAPASSRLSRAQGTIWGWGATEWALGGAGVLISGAVTILPPGKCAEAGGPWGSICATLPFTAEPSACWGDSGGPLEVGGVQVGVVSQGPAECDNSAPTLYTYLPPYRPWINWIAGGGDPAGAPPLVTGVTAQYDQRSRTVRMSVRWCRAGAATRPILAQFDLRAGNHRIGRRKLHARARAGACEVASSAARIPRGASSVTVSATVRDGATGAVAPAGGRLLVRVPS